MKSFKSLLVFTALSCAFSGAALANDSTLSLLKEKAKDMLAEQTPASDSATVQKMSEVYQSAKEKVNEVQTQVKESFSAEERAALKEKAEAKLAVAKDKVKSLVSSAKVDINKADAKTLQTLSGIGAKESQAIVAYREKVGKIKSSAELSKIESLGHETIERIKPYLSF